MTLATKPYLQTVRFKTPSSLPLDAYPMSIPAVKQLPEIQFHPDVTFFVGENGSGKSTVLEALAIALGYNAEGGNRNVRFQTTDSASSLHKSLILSRSFRKPTDGFFLRAESFFNVATYYLNEIGGSESYHEQSHGEAFLTLLGQKLKGHGIYLLDEPEAALSPERQLATLGFIHKLVLNHSQFIIATHSPILLAYPRAAIYQFSETGIAPVRYEETNHFRITKDFLNNPKRYLDPLLNDENLFSSQEAE
jgi:predicted ATPase